jgi:hypothetical protein
MERRRRLLCWHRPTAYRPVRSRQRCGEGLCQIVVERIELLETDGHPLPQPLGAKKFSGKFVLRVEPALRCRLAAKALAAGESLDSYCVKALMKE